MRLASLMSRTYSTYFFYSAPEQISHKSNHHHIGRILNVHVKKADYSEMLVTLLTKWPSLIISRIQYFPECSYLEMLQDLLHSNGYGI